MKKLLFSALTAALLFIAMGKTQAQIVPAVLADSPWYSDFGYIHGINSALIQFDDASTGGPNWLMVEDYYGNNTTGGLVFTDRFYQTTFQWDYDNLLNPYNTFIVGSPDIVVGNSASNPGSEYLVAAAYIIYDGTSIPNFKYRIDFFTVSYTGPGTFTVTHTGNTDIVGSITPYTIHIDIIAESNNLQRTGYAWCDRYIVTWDDLSAATAGVYAWPGSLNGGSPATISYATPGVQPIANGTYYRPDVAAIQRQLCAACAIDDIAMITYTGGNITDLYYQEWNVTSGGVTANPVWYVAANYIEMPRIDGPDNFNINNPGSGNAYFKISAQVDNVNSYTFDPVLGPFAFVDNANPGIATGLVNMGIPTIAFGANNQTQYTIAGEGEDLTPVRDIYMMPYDWSAPGAIALSPGGGSNWFEVNLTPLQFMNGGFLTAISTPCNNPGANTMISWSSHDPQTLISTVRYKFSDYVGIGNGYSFKGAPFLPEQEETSSSFGLSPNPATATITLNPGLPTGTYAITDMVGRIVLNGKVDGTKQAIDISQLPAGNYIIKAGANTGKFVKQ